MPEPGFRDRVEAALAEYDFQSAAEIAAGARDEPDLVDLVRSRRSRAEAEARALHARVTQLARDHDYRALLGLSESESTEPLLQLLPDDTRKRSLVHLRGAGRWAQRQVETNRRRVEEARKALAAMDLEFATGVLARLDDEFVDETLGAERNELLLAITARSIEIEELEESAGQAVRELRPPKRRFWRRRRD